MDASLINWFSVLVTSLVGFVIGPLWFGPLFGNKWLELIGKTRDDFKDSSMWTMLFAFIFQFIMAACLAMFFYGDPATTTAIGGGAGAFYGFLTGFGWVAMAFAVSALFELRSWGYIILHGCYWIIVFTLMGLILGVWR